MYHDSELEMFLYELKADLNAYLARLTSSPVRSLKDVIAFNESHRAEEMPYFGQDLFVKSEAKGPLTEKAYLDLVEKNRRLARTEGIDALMNKHKLDAIVAPTAGPAWLTDLINGDNPVGGGSSSEAAVACYPSVAVPAGFIGGLPVCMSFFGRAWSEPVLIQLAYAFEQATKFRKAPQFLPTLPLDPKKLA
jgi:amidase